MALEIWEGSSMKVAFLLCVSLWPFSYQQQPYGIRTGPHPFDLF